LGAGGLLAAVVVAITLADQESKPEAVEAIRSHIEKITLTPNDQGTLDIRLHGDLARILEFCEAAGDGRERADRGSKRERPGRGGPGRRLSVVAGACNQFCLLFTARGLIPRKFALLQGP
jgi:hypothetical protein